MAATIGCAFFVFSRGAADAEPGAVANSARNPATSATRGSGKRENSGSETPFLTVKTTGETPVPQSCHGLLGATVGRTVVQPVPTGTSDEPVQTDRPPVMPAPTARLADPAVHESEATPPTTQPAATAPTNQAQHDVNDLLRAIAPALVAIILAMVTRQVIVALSAGIFVAAALMLGLQGTWNPVTWLIAWGTLAIEKYLFGVLAPMNGAGTGVDFDHLKIIIFTLFIGAMIGVIEANGGTKAMVVRVTRRVGTRQRGQLGALLAGIVIFFDDYANAMIVGPSMRPVFDRVRLSREKLAYIVDSTAAPVASLFIGTWLAFEIAQLDEGFSAMRGSVPAFLEGINGTTAFLWSIPYRTYAWLALVMVFLVAVTGRDFGSMRKAESNAAAGRQTGQANGEIRPTETGQGWWLGFVPLLVLVVMVIGLMGYSGWRAGATEGVQLAWGGGREIVDSLGRILGKADSYSALLYGSLSAAVVAVVMSVLSRALSLARTMDGVVSGMSRMFAACIILVLAWGLSEGGKDLELGEAACAFLQREAGGGGFSVTFLPFAVFITAGIVSFSTGTSYGTMAILCPVVIPISANMLGALPPDQALVVFYAAVGAVLTGAVFGDHCSPISDTTVLSAIASECELSRHVWTQMPYAITVAIVGMLCTDGLNYGISRWAPAFHESYRAWSWAYGLAAGTVLLFLIVLIFGRAPTRKAVEPVIDIRQ
ncbi:MAG: hypothetical protein JXQ75_03510 [Phycisphaerae bacterium]|nr:hypothetical protein [Phycisphaerae bacterium]